VGLPTLSFLWGRAGGGCAAGAGGDAARPA
jgi:hypothetical protein